ncbi:hypothetical protein [uncultured Maribacter sp.]|uniref:hypothetical protein n=1 Tax=uncultured Maribacter sp. TaxID=431308 RepID=UPI0026247867|nr:hypothetical protein [uncultured Maribacter sp.]
MTVINLMFSISISLISLIINLNGGIETTEIQNVNLTKKNNCGIENVNLKTDRTEKEHKFLFWSLYRKKVKVTDRIIDSNGNVIFEKKSVFICSMDACDDRKFNRIKIVGKEIWIFSHGKNVEKVNPIKRYDFCGNFLGTKLWEDGDYYEI